MSELTVNCFYCNRPLDPTDPSNLRQVTGWEKKSTSYSRRGGSDVRLRKPTGEYACSPCIERLRAGLDVSQQGLFAT